MSDLMPTNKTWTSPEGVVLEFVPFKTILVDRIRDVISYPGELLSDEKKTFILCAGTLTNITLPELPPLWARALQGMLSSDLWQKDMKAIYDSLGHAPSNLMDEWFKGYIATRDHSFDGPPQLKAPIVKPSDDDQGQDGSPNPTTSVVKSSNASSLTRHGKQSRRRRRRN